MENSSSVNKKQFSLLGISIWRIFQYFIIYSIIGFLIETVFAIVCYGVLESRKGFLYGPFCSIYGVGAVIMILLLQYFKKNNYTLFVGGFVIGSVIEYVLSFLGEVILHVKWWDYSNRPFNINGRICISYSFFWGILALVLIKIVNPYVDKFINYLNKKISIHVVNIITSVIMIFLVIDCIVSGLAINLFFTRMIVKNDLDVPNKEEIVSSYEIIYNNNRLVSFINTFWNDKVMLITYPNLKIQLSDGSIVFMRDLLPEIKPYYYKFK